MNEQTQEALGKIASQLEKVVIDLNLAAGKAEEKEAEEMREMAEDAFVVLKKVVDKIGDEMGGGCSGCCSGCPGCGN